MERGYHPAKNRHGKEKVQKECPRTLPAQLYRLTSTFSMSTAPFRTHISRCFFTLTSYAQESGFPDPPLTQFPHGVRPFAQTSVFP
jgi:hypothetical protein